MAEQVAPNQLQQLHHFISTSPWKIRPVQRVHLKQAQEIVGGAGAVLIIDDSAIVKQGTHSVGVARQYCGELGKRANCQALVSLTLARGEVPVSVALKLFLPKSSAADSERCTAAGVPEPQRVHRPKWRIALDELDVALQAGVRFDCVTADVEYGKAAAFRRPSPSGDCATRSGFSPSSSSIRPTWSSSGLNRRAVGDGRESILVPPSQECVPMR